MGMRKSKTAFLCQEAKGWGQTLSTQADAYIIVVGNRSCKLKSSKYS